MGLAKPQVFGRDLRGVTSLERESGGPSGRINSKRAAAFDKDVRHHRGDKSPEGKTP